MRDALSAAQGSLAARSAARRAAARRLADVAAALWAAGIVVGTLRPAPTQNPATALLLADVGRNLALFAPLGLLLGSRYALGAVLVAGALLAGGVELLQAAIPGRDASAVDFAADAAAVAAGAALARRVSLLDGRRAAWGAAAAGLAAASALLLPALALRPHLPRGVYYVAWNPDHPAYGPFPGEIRAASVAGVPIGASGAAPDSGLLRRALASGAPVVVEAVRRREPDGVAPMVRINDADHEILLVGADGDDLVVGLHSVGGTLGLEEPLLRGRGALAGVALGEPFTVALARRGLAWRARVGAAEVGPFGPTPGSVWRLWIHDERVAKGRRRGYDALSVGALFAAVGLFARGGRVALAGFAAPLAALAAAPVTGMAATPPGEWAAAGAGLVAGALAARAAARWLEPAGRPARPSPAGEAP